MNLKKRLDQLEQKILPSSSIQIEDIDKMHFIETDDEADVIMDRLVKKYGPDFDESGVTFVRWLREGEPNPFEDYSCG